MKLAAAACLAGLAVAALSTGCQQQRYRSSTTYDRTTTTTDRGRAGYAENESGAQPGGAGSSATGNSTWNRSGSGNSAWNNNSSMNANPSTGMADAQRFASEVSAGNRAEIETGRIALRQAQNQRVREFAQRMIDDHTKADQELTQTLRNRSMAVTDTMPSHHRSMMDRLNNLSGADFDREYMRMMVRDHVDTIRKFEEQARSGKDQDIRAFADRTLPTLREHLRMARDIAREVGAETSER